MKTRMTWYCDTCKINLFKIDMGESFFALMTREQMDKLDCHRQAKHNVRSIRKDYK